MDFLELAEKRYSCRYFSDKEVEQDKIDAILRAGQLAPTAKNGQPQKIFVLKSEDAVAKANQMTPCMYGAPIALLVCVDDSLAYPRIGTGYNSADIDAAIVGTHMMLEASQVGLGSLWVLNFDVAKAQTLMELPREIRPVFMMPIGYESAEAHPSSRHAQTREIAEMVEYR